MSGFNPIFAVYSYGCLFNYMTLGLGVNDKPDLKLSSVGWCLMLDFVLANIGLT